MQKFHILHYIPASTLHILNGYNDVIETLLWGLQTLGYETTSGVNEVHPNARHIVLGAQFMTPEMLDQLPPSSLIYNLEQLDGCVRANINMKVFRHIGRRFTIWEYSTCNLAGWRTLEAQHVQIVPIGFAPVLCRIPRPDSYDIDVLFYGQPTEYRSCVIGTLCRAGLRIMTFYGLYGEARDALISRSKIVLNLRHDPATSIFSFVRAAYLLANQKAIVSDIVTADNEPVDGIAFVQPEQVASTCRYLADHDEERTLLETQGYEAFSSRNIVPYLQAALTMP